MNKLFLGIFMAIFFIALVPISAQAGGQLIHVTADSYGATNSDGTYGRIIRIVSQIKPCEGTEITLKFVDPKEGDYVMTQSGGATYTFTKDSQPYYQDGEQVCGTIAKMGSKVLGERGITVVEKNGNPPPILKVAFDGQYHDEDYHNGFGYSPSQDTPAYRLNRPGLTPKSKPTSLPIVNPTKPGDKPVIVSPAPSSDSEINDLNQKVNDLQNQLEQSKKAQSALEQKLNYLIDLVKRLLPFLK